ncbi:hypothetical protein K470DRAFT_211758 [Piedraia hortae CBS 480.64]|uniref:RWD domain-containing protein n=1 Tax=Piedraia hortae CBS 480.64 TaxID=1314780 RepID=A0A6A7C6T7_9PEZI|nr:hypothetical protein K470DRAFT_211758 [Piedraia hortae CBS 480.64]
MDDPGHQRIKLEIDLLESMYPDQIQFDPKAGEVGWRDDQGASLHLRLPESYPEHALPIVLSASINKTDVRELLRQRMVELQPGEEVLDSIVSAFQDLEVPDRTQEVSSKECDDGEDGESCTVVVWLHHLLNTNKRKQCLWAPETVSGLTKPGYPGVLVFSGPQRLVHAHVSELKQLNWQAFQVRLESSDEWTFSHSPGVKEVETMKEAVAALGPKHKQEFMEAMRMK